jgi:hypothetical protein
LKKSKQKWEMAMPAIETLKSANKREFMDEINRRKFILNH